MNYYNRYSGLDLGNARSVVPFIEIEKSSTDLYIRYDKSTMRLDTLSYKYYGDSNYGWLLLQANQEYGYYEYLIPDGSIFRIPYPLSNALKRYEDKKNIIIKQKL